MHYRSINLKNSTTSRGSDSDFRYQCYRIVNLSTPMHHKIKPPNPQRCTGTILSEYKQQNALKVLFYIPIKKPKLKE